MKIYQIIFILLSVVLSIDSSAQELKSNSLFDKNVTYKYWKVWWNDSLAVCQDSRGTRIDTIFKNISKYEDDTIAMRVYYYYESNQLLSIVGPYITFKVTYDGSGGAHPIYGTYYKLYNIETACEFSLLDIFNSSDIYTALLKNNKIRKYLTTSDPSNLDELLNNLDGQCEVDFSDILNDFAFYDVHGNSVLIEFGLTHGCEALHGKFTSIDIFLPIPGDKQALFQRAKDNKTLKKYLE